MKQKIKQKAELMKQNNQIDESESTNEGPFNPIRKEPQENKKFPNCLTKNNLQQLVALYNNWKELENGKIWDVTKKLSSTISELKDSQEPLGYRLITLTI